MERERSHNHARHKLRRDRYKEWVSSFNESVRESAEKRADASRKSQLMNGYQSV